MSTPPRPEEDPVQIFRLSVRSRGEAAAAADPEPLEAFRKAVAESPRDADYHFILGQALLERGQPREALTHLEEACRLDAEIPEHHRARGMCLLRLHRDEAAAEALAEWLRMREDDVEAHNALGVALTRLGRHREAEAAFQEGLKRAKGSADIRNDLGVALWGLGRKEEALKCFERAAQADAVSATPHLNLGTALALLGRKDEALAPLLRARAIDAKSAEVAARLGGTLASLSRGEEAEASFKEALALDPRILDQRKDLKALHDELTVARVRKELKVPVDARMKAERTLLAILGATGHAIAEFLKSVPKLVYLGMLAVATYLILVFLPPYVRHFSLRDEIVDIARSPTRQDTEIGERIRDALSRRDLEKRVSDLEVVTRSNSRRIAFRYPVEVSFFPGLSYHSTVSLEVDEPSLLAAGTP